MKCYEVIDLDNKGRRAVHIFAADMFCAERIAVRDFGMALPVARKIIVPRSQMKATTLNGCLG